jgi:hypothetical protein
MKRCGKCKIEKELIEFYIDNCRKSGRNPRCKTCSNKHNKEYRTNPENLIKLMLNSARQRALKYNVPFTIEAKDINIPTHCPILDIPLVRANLKANANSPSLDRTIPALGYVPGNIVVISYKANTIKSYGTLEEHKKLVEWMGKQMISSTEK